MIGEDFPALLAAAQRGDESAFSALWRDANPLLLRYLRVVAPEVAEDAAAGTWVSVVRGLGSFRGAERDWRAWLFSTARRRAADSGRRRDRRPGSLVADAGEGGAPLATGPAGTAPENPATRDAIAAVAALPPLEAEVIMLRVVGGLGTDVVARLVGCSPAAVRAAAHRGLRRLTHTFAETGVTL